MSWLFSQALVEEYLGENCSDGEPFAQLNVMPTQHKFWRNDKTMEFSNLSRFGLTCRLLTEKDGEELLTLFLAAFPVKTLALQEKAPESQGSAAECGNTWRASLARFDQNSSSWKTVQHSLLEDSESCLATWPRSGMTANGQCWELPMLEPGMDENDAGLWPTPNAQERGGKHKPGSHLTLTKAVNGWVKGVVGGPTQCPEPVYIGELNPMWVEWLMGWPLGWTDLKPLEMDKFHSVQQEHLDFYVED